MAGRDGGNGALVFCAGQGAGEFVQVNGQQGWAWKETAKREEAAWQVFVCRHLGNAVSLLLPAPSSMTDQPWWFMSFRSVKHSPPVYLPCICACVCR